MAKITVQINESDTEDFVSGDGVDIETSTANYLTAVAKSLSKYLGISVECETSGVYDHKITVNANMSASDEYDLLQRAEEYYTHACDEAANNLDEIIVME